MISGNVYRSMITISILALAGTLISSNLEARGKPTNEPSNGPTLIVTLLDPGTGGFGEALTSSLTGVMSDGNPVYADGVSGVRAYLGVAGKDFVLVTYNSGRTLHFEFDSNSSALNSAGLPSAFDAEVDMFGINYWGPYMEMGDGTTAQVQSDLEFKYGGITWELDYQSLAVKRLSSTEWILTTAAADIGGWSPGFTPSDQAALSSIKKRRNQSYGTVNMPLRLMITLKNP